MNGNATHELARIHQHELMAEADHARLAKQARLASKGTQSPARHPLTWIREAAMSLVAKMTPVSSAHVAGGH